MNIKEISTEIVVIGGGMSGCCAALAAARQGRKVSLVEKASFLGGVATQVQFGEMNGVKKDGKDIYSGIFKEILDILINEGYGEYYIKVPMSSNPSIKVDRIRYNAEILKLILDKLLLESGVQILFNCYLDNISTDGSCVKAILGNHYNKITISAQIIIDATGNAEIADALGYRTYKPSSKQVQSTTTAFHLTNVDIIQVQQFIESGKLSKVIHTGFIEGYLKGQVLSICPIPKTNTVAINATRSEHVDHESVIDVSRGLLETRCQIYKMIPYLRHSICGMENATLSYISTNLGVRDRRRIHGHYTLTGQDLISLRKFDDTIALGAYPIDIHDPVTKGVRFIDTNGIYQIPYLSMIPEGSTRLIVTGRAISADDDAFAAIRVIPIVSNIGEAAGHAAHLAVRDNVFVNQIDIVELKHLQGFD